MNDRAAARFYGVGESTVRRWRKDLGLPRRYDRPALPSVPRQFPSAAQEEADDLVLAQRFDVPVGTIEHWRRVTRFRETAPSDIEHGNRDSYLRHGCPCELCRSAHRAGAQERYAERLLETAMNGGVAPVEVHNAQTYANWGCRCEQCRAAKSVANRVQRERRQRLRSAIKA